MGFEVACYPPRTFGLSRGSCVLGVGRALIPEVSVACKAQDGQVLLGHSSDQRPLPGISVCVFLSSE